MTTGHLITYADLTTLSDINLRHLDDAIRQFVTDSKVEFLTLENSVHLLIFRDIIEYALRYELVLMRISSPTLEQN